MPSGLAFIGGWGFLVSSELFSISLTTGFGDVIKILIDFSRCSNKWDANKATNLNGCYHEQLFFRFDYETALICRLYEDIRDDDGEK